MRYAPQMHRRDLLRTAAALGLGLLTPAAMASDSANSSQGSGDSSGASGDSSAGSGDSSAGSGESSRNSSNSSNSGEGSGEPVAESSGEAGVLLLSTTVVALGMSLTAGVIVLIIVLVKNGKRRRKEEAELLRGSLLGARRDLGGVLALASASPSALDLLVAEAVDGEGEALDALARATGLGRARVADAVVRVWAPVTTEVEATRFALRLLDELAPELTPAPDAVAGWLDQLAHERGLPTPGEGPAHSQLAVWMGVGDHDLAPIVRASLPTRQAIHGDPLGVADRLADQVAAAFPTEVRARLAALEARVRHIDEGLGAGILG